MTNRGNHQDSGLKHTELCVECLLHGVPQPPTGWMNARLAERPPLAGGLGMPNFVRELIAMSASVVGEWALSDRRQLHLIGDILQVRDSSSDMNIVPRGKAPPIRVQHSLRATGRPWVEYLLSYPESQVPDEKEQAGKPRSEMKFRNGLQTRWTSAGLAINVSRDGRLNGQIHLRKRARCEARGECLAETVMLLPLADLWLWDSQGRERKWSVFNKLVTNSRTAQVQDLMSVEYVRAGVVVVKPSVHTMPMRSGDAHLFRELSLSLLANYPELTLPTREKYFLRVHHELDDKHHLFEVSQEEGCAITHSWGTNTTTLGWCGTTPSVVHAVAQRLAVEPNSVWITPHPRLTRITPLWAGNRRWTQSRRRYKNLTNQNATNEAAKSRARISDKWQRTAPSIATALATLQWKRIHKMEGVTAYQTQNIIRLKLNRLRVWAGQERGFKCTADTCSVPTEVGSAHLVWHCPEAAVYWETFINMWGLEADVRRGNDPRTQEVMADIFSFRLRRTPSWLIQWGKEKMRSSWDSLHRSASELWAIGYAVTVSLLWRRNVERAHPDSTKELSLKAAREEYKQTVLEAYLRGNPGPGGSGSVVVEVGDDDSAPRIMWAAAIALGRKSTTNNEAEFVGLHRIPTKALEQNWTRINVVGDSALILRMMAARKAPKSRKLQHWYRIARRLAELCEVQSWRHLYRKHNKMADWIANYAMNTCRSTTVAFGEDNAEHAFHAEVTKRLMYGCIYDVAQWMSAQMADSQDQSLHG